MLIRTSNKNKKGDFGCFYYSVDKDEKVIQEDRFLLIFRGYLYPDINLNIKELFNFFKQSTINKEFKKFKGRYCGCFIDKEKEEITIFNDQLGLNDIFYYYREKTLIVSNKFVSLLNLNNFKKEDLDFVALGEFLMFEHPLLDRTFIKSIKLLPYATIKSFNLKYNQIRAINYWKYLPKSNSEFDIHSIFEKLDNLFKTSLKRIKALNPSKSFAIGLSGGLDSRLVAKYAIEEGLDLKPFVFSNKDADAFHVARKIAKTLDLDLKELVIKDHYYSLKDEHIKYDPMMNIMYTTKCSIRNELPRAGCLLTGFYGGELFGNHMSDDFQKFIKSYARGKDAISDELYSNILMDLTKYSHMNLSDLEKTHIFDFENRQLRFVKNNPIFNYYGMFENNFSMFSDIDLVEFVLTLSSNELYKCKLYHEFITEFHPELAKIRPERIPYSISDTKIAKKIKLTLFNLKRKGGKWKLFLFPLYRHIMFLSFLDWKYFFKKIDFIYEYQDIQIKGIHSKLIKDMPATYTNNVITKYNYLTIKEFMKSYIN